MRKIKIYFLGGLLFLWTIALFNKFLHGCLISRDLAGLLEFSLKMYYYYGIFNLLIMEFVDHSCPIFIDNSRVTRFFLLIICQITHFKVILKWYTQGMSDLRAKMYWNLIWKSPRFVPFVNNRTLFCSNSDIPDCACAAVGSGVSDFGRWAKMYRKSNRS